MILLLICPRYFLCHALQSFIFYILDFSKIGNLYLGLPIKFFKGILISVGYLKIKITENRSQPFSEANFSSYCRSALEFFLTFLISVFLYIINNFRVKLVELSSFKRSVVRGIWIILLIIILNVSNLCWIYSTRIWYYLWVFCSYLLLFFGLTHKISKNGKVLFGLRTRVNLTEPCSLLIWIKKVINTRFDYYKHVIYIPHI